MRIFEEILEEHEGGTIEVSKGTVILVNGTASAKDLRHRVLGLL